jgi:hypothetical protein
MSCAPPIPSHPFWLRLALCTYILVLGLPIYSFIHISVRLGKTVLSHCRTQGTEVNTKVVTHKVWDRHRTHALLMAHPILLTTRATHQPAPIAITQSWISHGWHTPTSHCKGRIIFQLWLFSSFSHLSKVHVTRGSVWGRLHVHDLTPRRRRREKIIKWILKNRVGVWQLD